MDNSTIQRYQPGGDIYAKIVAQYGVSAANTIATAANTGDRSQVQNALENAAGIPAASTDNTLQILAGQLYDDPFTAPIQQAQTIATNTVTSAGNAVKSIAATGLGNLGIWILVAVVGVALFFYFGGSKLLRK